MGNIEEGLAAGPHRRKVNLGWGWEGSKVSLCRLWPVPVKCPPFQEYNQVILVFTLVNFSNVQAVTTFYIFLYPMYLVVTG